MVKEVVKEEFNNIILGDKVVVDCYASWCGPCKMLAPIIEELSEELTNISFYKLDVDALEEIAYEYKIMSIPTLLIFEKGKLIKTLVGFKTKEELLSELK